jgi:hypothetical protein
VMEDKIQLPPVHWWWWWSFCQPALALKIINWQQLGERIEKRQERERCYLFQLLEHHQNSDASEREWNKR